MCSDLCSFRATGPADGPSNLKQSKSWSCSEVCERRISTSVLHTKRPWPQPTGPLVQNTCFFEMCLFPTTVFNSSLLAFYIISAHPFSPTTYLSSFACSCPAQTRAKRLILALRSSKLSQLSSFSPLSVSISSNTLPGCRYGHQRAGWYFWPPCVRN